MNVEELLWKYAEGGCDAREKAALEKLLAGDPSLRKELETVQLIHGALQTMEPEQPSMRFTKKLMEALPQIYQPADAEPLVPSFWKKIFWVAVAAVLAAVILRPSPGSGAVLPLVGDFGQGIASLLHKIPGSGMTFFVLIFLSVVTLALADKLLGRRLAGLKD